MRRLIDKVKRRLNRTRVGLPIAGGRARRFAKLTRHMAYSGAGTDACLDEQCLPMQVHFYSPVPDINDLTARRVWSRRSDMPGVDFRAEQQRALLRDQGRAFGGECRWPMKPTSDPGDFHLDNGCFSFGCAAALHTMIRRHQPRRLIEVGSGYSSRVIAAALRRNADGGGETCRYTIIDPYPGPVIEDRKLPFDVEVRPERVECVGLDEFAALGADDILFIDSGHTVRIGGDVNFEFLEVLPRLNPGVVVHVHDIPMPYEYPEVYCTNPQFRMFWTESYLLQAFLAFNDRFEVLLAMNYLETDHPELMDEAFPGCERGALTSSSFWIRRKPGGEGRGG